MSDIVKLQKELEILQGERAELIAEREATAKRKEALESEASASLTSVALRKLAGQARTQAEREIEARGLELTMGELDRRIGQRNEEITSVEEAIVNAKFAAAQAEVDAIELEAARTLEKFVQLVQKTAAISKGVYRNVAGTERPESPILTFGDRGVREASKLLMNYGQQYTFRHGEMPPVPILIPTSNGIEPARRSHFPSLKKDG